MKVPIDLTQLPQFRLLREKLGRAELAMLAWFTLWQELSYRLQDGGEAGRLRSEDAPGVEQAMESAFRDIGLGEHGMLEKMVAARLLVRDGEDYVCPRFAVLHAGSAGRSQAQRGGDMRAYALRQRKAQGEAFQQSLLIPASRLVDAEGKPLSAEMVKRVTRLVVACDNALFKGARPSYGYTEGLIQDALRVLGRFTDEEIDAMCRTVALKRTHPALNGMNAEKLLPGFAEVAGRLG